jgi:hypothetical protein
MLSPNHGQCRRHHRRGHDCLFPAVAITSAAVVALGAGRSPDQRFMDGELPTVCVSARSSTCSHHERVASPPSFKGRSRPRTAPAADPRTEAPLAPLRASEDRHPYPAVVAHPPTANRRVQTIRKDYHGSAAGWCFFVTPFRSHHTVPMRTFGHGRRAVDRAECLAPAAVDVAGRHIPATASGFLVRHERPYGQCSAPMCRFFP